jgi:hypothetical protein
MAGPGTSALAHLALQVPLAAESQGMQWNMWEAIRTFINTPAPYSPFSEYLAVLFFLWLVARRNRKPTDANFSQQAQDVLETKHASGELSRKTYDKFRQDVALRPKR